MTDKKVLCLAYNYMKSKDLPFATTINDDYLVFIEGTSGQLKSLSDKLLSMIENNNNMDLLGVEK